MDSDPNPSTPPTMYDAYLSGIERFKNWLRRPSLNFLNQPADLPPQNVIEGQVSEASLGTVAIAVSEGETEGPVVFAAPMAFGEGVLPINTDLQNSALHIRQAVQELQRATGNLEASLKKSQSINAIPRVVAAPVATPALGSNIRWETVALWATVVALLAVRFWQLRELQNEVYGDVNIVIEYVENILKGHWPFYFDLSSGPLYHYLITPVVLAAGLNYAAIKLASVLTSLGVLTFMFLFARRLINFQFAIIVTFIAGISYWLLIFSRLGNSQILVPLLVIISMWLLLRYVQDRRIGDLMACAAVGALGLYGYPQSFIIAPVMFVVLVVLHFFGVRLERPAWIRFITVCIVIGLPFLWILTQGLATADGYLGSKLATNGNLFVVLAGNIVRALGAFNFVGDSVNRSNPNSAPHLDFVSGLLFLVGIVYWLRSPERIKGLVVLLPFFLLQVPSMLVLGDPAEIPSASRAIGAAPLAYILVASGLWQGYEFLRGRYSRKVAMIWGAVLLAIITVSNLIMYFVVYINQLPLNNTPIARLIVNYIDLLPDNTNVYLVDCCWEAGMPEPKSVIHEMRNPDKFFQLDPEKLNCENLDDVLNGPAVIIWNNKETLPAPGLADCSERIAAQQYASPQGYPVFHAAPVIGVPVRIVVPVVETPGTDNPVAGTNPTVGSLLWDGQLVTAHYSELDIGRIEDAVDGNVDSLMRAKDANPFVIEFEFTEPRTAASMDLTTATLNLFTVKVELTYADGTTEAVENTYSNLPSDPTVTVDFPSPENAIQTLHIEIQDTGPPPGDGYHVHVREIKLEPGPGGS